MSACREISALLPEFVGDDLASSMVEHVRAHLIDCSACRRVAGSLQRSRAALRSAAVGAERAFDETAFATMHRSIVAATTAAMRGDELSQRTAQRRPGPWWLLAAAALVVGGAWFGMQSRRESSVWHRLPTATPAAEALVVPWSGQRVDLQLLGDERSSLSGEGFGTGLMGRHRLRMLVDEGIQLPLPPNPR